MFLIFHLSMMGLVKIGVTEVGEIDSRFGIFDNLDKSGCETAGV